MTKRIAILVKEFPPNVIGGTETQTRRMARELANRDYEVTVFTKAYVNTPDTDQEPFEVVRVPNWSRSSFLSTLTFVLGALLTLIWRHRQFDVLHSMMVYPTGFVGFLVSAVTGLPYFAWIRGGDYYFMKDNPVKRHLIRRVLTDTLVLVQTQRVRRDVESEFDDTTLRVVGNGVDLPDRLADGNALVYVGRLKEQKGVHFLLRALDGLDERLIIVGDGPYRKVLESLTADLDVDVTFVGEVPPEEVNNYLRQGKAFVLPSFRGEGLPNAVLEAMALGLPTVVTDTGGVADAVREEMTGYVVEPGDVDALRDRIRRLSDEERCAEMGVAAREFVEQEYSWDAITARLDDVYRRVTESS
mgnify:CR=1 FL=1